MDNCSTGLNATFSDVKLQGVGFQNKFEITRTWNLVDNCGNSAIPLTQIITVKDLIAPTITGCPSNLTLPGITIENSCGAYFGVQTQPVINDNCEGDTVSYVLTGGTNASGTGFLSNTQIIREGVTTVTYTVTDAVGNLASCSFTITVNCITISGKLIWADNHASGVQDGTVRLTRRCHWYPIFPISTAIMNWRFLLLVSTRLHRLKNINRLNGVTAADATAIQAHISGAAVITNPYRKVAADVNRTGFITTQDATLITQSIAGNPNALAVFNVFWRFVPTTYTMPVTPPATVPGFPESITYTISGPDTTDANFYGMKIGDVNGSANPSIASHAGTPLVWMIQDQMLQPGTVIALDFAATNFTDLAALQFAFRL